MLCAWSLLLPCLVVFLCLKRLNVTGRSTALAIALSMGLGMGLASCLHYLWLAVPGASTIPFWLADTLAWCLLAAAVFSVRPVQETLAISRGATTEAASLPLACCTGALAVCVLIALVVLQTQYPWGTDDALAMWNLHARVLYLDPHWQEFFSSLSGFDPHKDYPLLVPGAIARLWRALGWPNSLIPSAVSVWFTSATALLCYGAVAALRGRDQALLAVLVLLGTSYFVKLGGNQMADIPLSFFITAALVLLLLNGEAERWSGHRQALAGLSAGLAAWTKNEGLLFVVALFTAQAITAFKGRTLHRYCREMLLILAGAAGILLIVGSFKLFAGQEGHLFPGLTASTILVRLEDPSRYATIASGMAREFLGMGKGMVLILPVYFLLMGASRRAGNPALRCTVLTLTLVAAGYFTVYLFTPLPLAWMVSGSAGRLSLHLWPALLVVFFLCVATPADVLTSSQSPPAGEQGRPLAIWPARASTTRETAGGCAPARGVRRRAAS
jgi:hypothetical protein